MAKQKASFQVPIQTDILSGGNVGMTFQNGNTIPVNYIFICKVEYIEEN